MQVFVHDSQPVLYHQFVTVQLLFLNIFADTVFIFLLPFLLLLVFPGLAEPVVGHRADAEVQAHGIQLGHG